MFSSFEGKIILIQVAVSLLSVLSAGAFLFFGITELVGVFSSAESASIGLAVGLILGAPISATVIGALGFILIAYLFDKDII